MLPEDLMLLFINEQNGKLRTDSSSVENALAGAVLIELVNSGRVAFDPNGKKLQVVDPTPLKDPLLQESVARFDKPMKPQRAVERLRKKVRDNVAAQLEGRGVVRVEPRKVLGIFPAKSYVITDETAAAGVRKAVGEVALGYRGADARTGALITLLHAVKAVHKVFDGDKRDMTKRAKEIAAGNWAGDAVRRALEAIQAGVVAATAAATAASQAG
ncbi:Golgi phosphoprotein 3 (GPP34) [Lentzea albidocapillata subsp. violacea]|uniref:Golgi phosphoprotein 3 (GPP34) n=1 Tax=Lentzea albidocapillata subsp. violacea TaxID=128104 RepID=A0A1G9DUN1_9PSEU|nr:GPP34 family phosphoprotein [Lentzea albidocapillata]SDK67550.1 Golgi phosphoprotein 3 (GPP34) [Lentzea albidocapillata subsp. violacea]